MATLTPKVLLDGIVFPEGPRWHKGKLWFSDIHAKKVMTVDEQGHAEVVVTVPERPSGLGWLPDGRLLIVSMRNRQLLCLDPDGLHTVADVSALVKGLINDMVVDAQGRAYIGSTGYDVFAGEAYAPGNVVMVTPDGKARVVADNLEFPNGPVITPDHKTFIVAESFGHRLAAFDIALDGSLSGRRVFAELGQGTPDGICLDAEGAVWVSSPLTHEFLRVKQGGAVAERVTLSDDKLAIACMLGGEDRRTLFLLTAETSVEDLLKDRSKGYIETVRVDVPGAGLP
jgi:sugar lactone lactonase YvrE